MQKILLSSHLKNLILYFPQKKSKIIVWSNNNNNNNALLLLLLLLIVHFILLISFHENIMRKILSQIPMPQEYFITQDIVDVVDVCKLINMFIQWHLKISYYNKRRTQCIWQGGQTFLLACQIWKLFFNWAAPFKISSNFCEAEKNWFFWCLLRRSMYSFVQICPNWVL